MKKKKIKYYLVQLKSLAFVIRDAIVYYWNKNKKVNYISGNRENSKALVFGNGPSLKEFLIEFQFKFDNCDIFVCNAFAISSHYEELKPSKYVLLDPLYFDFNDSRVVNNEVNVIQTWEAILSKTTWPLTLYTSLFDKDLISIIKEKLLKNKNIELINIHPLKFISKNRYTYYSKGLGLIGGITVTHFSVQIAILSRYEEVFMCGVDLDWIENMNYDDNKHKVYLLNKHFYDEEKIYYGEGIFVNTDMVVEFNALHLTFKMFKDLYNMALYFNVKLYRGSKSFADFIPFKKYK
uniref:6-hydroxymethylpterin diphosphokinase MptE-like protein n=1 Tax=Algoriphagus sp. TaxID=1872435 RepID=UPI004048EAAF